MPIGAMIFPSEVEIYGQLMQQQQEPKTNTISTQQQQPIPPSTSLSTNQIATEGWRTSFDLENCDFSPAGENSYFILNPGHQLVLEGHDEDSGKEHLLTITVLNETKEVNGTETGVIEEVEKEKEGGNLVEISKNYFAICKPKNNAIYFGEHVDMYENHEIVSHEGSWLAGQNGAKAGMIMPSKVEVGMKYYQEIVPGVAEDRAEVVSVNDSLNTPAGNFENVLKTEESNPLEPGDLEYKFYAPGIGLVQEKELKLVNHTQPVIN